MIAVPKVPTPEEARQSLNGHVTAKGGEIRAKYGPHIGWPELQRILADRDFVRYPCELAFNAEPLQSGELAFPQPKGEHPEDGFTLCIHPYFSLDLTRVPNLALYQLVSVNYGAFASSDDAESFGAAALGLGKEEYYRILCAMADEISTGNLSEEDYSPRHEGCTCGAKGSA
jgi:hypothetical protein